MLVRFKDSPDPGMHAPGSENKVLHASFRIENTILMASDGRCKDKPSFKGFSLSHTVPNEAEAKRLFPALADNREIQLPLSKTFFSPCFGMETDRFSVFWMIIVAADSQ